MRGQRRAGQITQYYDKIMTKYAQEQISMSRDRTRVFLFAGPRDGGDRVTDEGR